MDVRIPIVVDVLLYVELIEIMVHKWEVKTSSTMEKGRSILSLNAQMQIWL